jgi:hypothetical protein
MKTPVTGLMSRVVFGVGLILLLGAPAQAAQWRCIHGHSGHIEYLTRVQTTERAHIGWGLDFDQKSGLYNWIHFAVPTVFGQTTRYIALQFWTGSVDAVVDSVHVYNGGDRVMEFEDLGWADGWHEEILDLGEEMTFAALGISIEIGAGVEMMDHRFLFTGACALGNP